MEAGIKLTDFLTMAQIKAAAKLGRARAICDEIILPNIDVINFKLGQENDPMYLAYATEYVLSHMGRGR